MHDGYWLREPAAVAINLPILQLIAAAAPLICRAHTPSAAQTLRRPPQQLSVKKQSPLGRTYDRTMHVS
jgi:hypothetical protein